MPNHPPYFGENQNSTRATTENSVSGYTGGVECVSLTQAVRDGEIENGLLGRPQCFFPEDQPTAHIHDQEAVQSPSSKNIAASTPPLTQFTWLIVWCINNIGVTLLNKLVFHGLSGKKFEYPYMLSATHMLVGWIGTSMVFAYRGMKRKRIPGHIYRSKVLLFSTVFRECSVSFNQVIRSLVPAIVMILGYLLYSQIPSFRKRVTVIPVVFGVAMACYGDMACSTVGMCYSVLCSIFAGLKVVLSGQMLTGELNLPPLDLLDVMAPLALGQFLLLSYLSNEISDIFTKWNEIRDVLWIVIIGAICSFTLNITSFQANRVTSPLTLSVAANMKQVVLIWLDLMIFPTRLSIFNAMGMFIVVVGTMYYSRVSLSERLENQIKVSKGRRDSCSPSMHSNFELKRPNLNA